MEFVGGDVPAPRVIKAVPVEPRAFALEVIVQMKKLFKAGLVHADLSGFNILNYDDKPVFIDFSQATPLNNPRAGEFLDRDIKNVCSLFKKWGLNFSQEFVKKRVVGK
ncbi:hypothetical protein B6U93_03010 [Candidatus Woesearchaeota archaeon ex4484_78]|nr:MAG: hypothetical protein B6U93_03010 [Candidatus Woesearchaeota archaeon ex4484_78]